MSENKNNEVNTMDTIDKLLEMIKTAEENGEYDAFADLELEYQKIVASAKTFNSKIEEMYKRYKKEECNENKK